MDQLSAEVKLQLENKVHEIINDLLTCESVERSFAGFIVRTPEALKRSHDSKMHNVLHFWKSLMQSSECNEFAIRCFVARLFTQNGSRSGTSVLFGVLETLVENSLVSVRLVCESLLSSDRLTSQNSDQWCQTLKLIRRIIGGVDYKGCRDLLRLLFERSQSIPVVDNTCSIVVMDAVYSVISYILDRNVCLLPSYFAVNEIIKLFAEDRPQPHWKLGQLLAEFVQTFRPAAQMVSICGRSHLYPVVGHSSCSSTVWRLNTNNLRFTLIGPLPYEKELMEPQAALLRYVLEQPYSREMVCSILNLNKQLKQRCAVLEEQIIDLIVIAMERSEEIDDTVEEAENLEDSSNSCIQLWQHLSSQLIFFVLFQLSSFPHIVNALYEKLKIRKLRKGRDHLMWILLQFISGSIQKNPLEDFLPVMKLYDLLYPETEPLQLPTVTHASCTFKMAVTSIWIHLSKKAHGDKTLQRPIPQALSGHIDLLQQCLANKSTTMTDYRIALLCNAYSTNPEHFALPMGVLVEMIYGNSQKTTVLPGNVVAQAPTQPLAMSLLDSLTVHAKMSLIHSIVTRVIKLAQTKASPALAPALVETYSRLLVYIEIESLGIKGFISQLLPSVFKSNAWGILHTLLEMFSYRLHHIQPHYRIQLLSQLHQLAQVLQLNQYQLHLCVESTALHLIMGLGSWEVQPQLSRIVNEPKSIVLLSNDSEELNRAMVLTLARAMHVTGSESMASNWCRDILVSIMAATPHSWSTFTLACFPPALAEFFQQQQVPPRDDKLTLKRNVEMECRRWKSMATENELITHFTAQTTQPLFICVLWKSLVEDNRLAPTAYKVLDRLTPRAMSAQLRTFADYLICEFSSGNQQLSKTVDSLNDLIWKCSVIPVDRLVLSLCLRPVEGNDIQVCFTIIQVLLLRANEFRTRVLDFVRENSPDHWLQSNWHEKHVAFHKKHPEKYYFEMAPEMGEQPQHQYLPVYFGNLCLRFLPVFDIVIHRFIEINLPQGTKPLESLLDFLGALYKFHDRPLTYLYNTLHYYDKKLQTQPGLKRKLVTSIIGAFKDIKPNNWCLSEDFIQYTNREDTLWVPDVDYYLRLICRLVDTLTGLPAFPSFDWRFNEFPNSPCHALYSTCIELMALPVTGADVGNALYDIILKGLIKIPRDKVFAWMNAIGIVITALPECYWIVLHDRVIEAIHDPHLSDPSPDCNIFHLLNFTAGHQVMGEVRCSYVLALCHAVWVHASIGQLSTITHFMKEKLKPIVRTEEQFLFVCHLVGPFFQRFHIERTRCMLDLTVELYEMLEVVDKSVEHLRYLDPISDFLYHIKYMFVGDGVKAEVEKVIRSLRPALQLRLRFISHHGREENTPVTTQPTSGP